MLEWKTSDMGKKIYSGPRYEYFLEPHVFMSLHFTYLDFIEQKNTYWKQLVISTASLGFELVQGFKDRLLLGPPCFSIWPTDHPRHATHTKQ